MQESVIVGMKVYRAEGGVLVAIMGTVFVRLSWVKTAVAAINICTLLAYMNFRVHELFDESCCDGYLRVIRLNYNGLNNSMLDI